MLKQFYVMENGAAFCLRNWRQSVIKELKKNVECFILVFTIYYLKKKKTQLETEIVV